MALFTLVAKIDVYGDLFNVWIIINQQGDRFPDQWKMK